MEIGSVERAISSCSLGLEKDFQACGGVYQLPLGSKGAGKPRFPMPIFRNAKRKIRPRLTDAGEANVLRHSLVGHFYSLDQSRISEQGLDGMG